MTSLSLKTQPEYVPCPTYLPASGGDNGPGILRTFSLVDNRQLLANRGAQFSSIDIELSTIYRPDVGTQDLCNQTSQGIFGVTEYKLTVLLNSEEAEKGQKEVYVNFTGELSEEYMDSPLKVQVAVMVLYPVLFID